MAVYGCRLCAAAASSLDDASVVLCNSVASLALGPKSDDQKGTTVADVLKKHFWFAILGDRDVNAFVCQPCWIKVLDFHQFYQTVLVLHDHNSLAIQPKLEVILNEDAEQSNSHIPSNCSDDEGADNTDWYDDAFRADVKKEQDADDEAGCGQPTPSQTPTKRSRGRQPSKSKCTIDRINVKSYPASSVTTKSVDDPDKETDRLAAYFTLKCDLCDEPLSNLAMARNHHQQVHKQRGYLNCSCGQRFSRNSSIREHCAFHANPSPHKCAECCKVFTSAGRLIAHQNAKHSTTGSPSAAANAAANPAGATTKSSPTNPSPDELIRRYMSMVCTLCDSDKRTAYDSYLRLRQHQRKVHGQIGYLECCGKQFVNKCRAIEHCKRHENPQMFDCNICGRSFANSVNLRDHHVRQHSSNAPFSHQCDQCDSSFQLIVQLRYHKRRAHMSEDDQKFECFSCHRRFVFKSQLRLHLRLDQDQGPTIMCDVCAKNFKSKHKYELHYALEHGGNVAKCQCPECGKWLKHAARLSRHMVQHRSKPSKCAECDHVAPNAKAMYMHRQRMHCEPKHKCLVCNRMFKRLLTLREHMAMHAGITDLYTCMYCPQTFRSHANMYNHRRQVHAAQFEADRHAAKLAEEALNTAEAAAAAVNPVVRMR